MKHEMCLYDDPFKLIQSGTKTIEMRLFDEKRQLIQVGDEIEFINRVTGEKQLTEVIAMHIYGSFTDIYRDYDKVSLGYDANEDADPKDMEQYYSKEEQEKYGVVCIEIIKINS